MPPIDSSLTFGSLAAFVTPGYLTPGPDRQRDRPDAAAHAHRLASRSSLMTASPLEPGHPATGEPWSDVDLVRAMAAGDERAATLLYDRTSAVLYGLALRIVGEAADADDVVVDCYAQAWREAARFDATKASVIAWLTMMTRSRALDVVRARQRRDKVTDRAALEPDQPVAMSQDRPGADVALEHAERAHAVTDALDSLPPAQRTAIELAFFEGLTHPEVAERLREPLGTVKTRIRLGMQKLRDALGRWAPDAGERAS
jgi:RNA polymerase sigma-70 factor (ECF subfamily)